MEAGLATIALADSAGGNIRQLTTEGFETFRGSLPWSPDGTALVYTSNRTGTDDIWLLPVNGDPARPLTNDVREDNSPFWSPDGQWIAFFSNRGQQSDLWVFPAASWGAGLHAFSGSKEHVVALRTRAGRLGLHVSEHGVADRRDGRRLDTGRFEEEIFAAVGLPFIAPELRECLGEIEAAEKGRLPHLIEAAASAGADVLGLCWRTPLDQAAARVGDGVALQGNLDPHVLFADPAAIRAEAHGVLDRMAGRAGHIMNLGHGIMPDTPIAGVEALVAAVHDHRGTGHATAPGQELQPCTT